MDKYPVLENGTVVGELTVWPENLYTVFDVSCPGHTELRCAWAMGETGAVRIGVPEPENGTLRLRRRFSRELTAPAGALLQGELHPLGDVPEQWGPLSAPLRSAYLHQQLHGRHDVLDCRAHGRRLLAIPRDDTAPFPLEAMFCFVRLRRLRGRDYWTFAFDGSEWPVF